MAELDQFFVPTPDEIRDSNLRVRRNGLIARGVTNPNVTKDSDHYVYATALSENLAPAFQNCVIKSDEQMPDTAKGDQLTRIMGFYGVAPAVATGASGSVVISTSTPTLVAVDTQLIDDQGQVFEVTIGGTYGDGDEVPIAGISTGKSTDHETGDVLQWVGVPPAFAAPTVTVASPGLTGGADTPKDEDNRAALFSHLQNPPGGGNWSQVQGWALKASSSVVAAYVYPALNGPGTLGLCILGALSYDPTNGFSREVPSAVRDTVHNYVVSQLPGPGQVLLTTKTPTDSGGATPDVDVDVAMGLSLPEAVGAGGPGGGWVDATPWPVLLGTATRCTVSVVTDSTHLTLTSNDAATTPSSTGLVDGVTQIAWFSPTSFAASTTDNPLPAIITATVTSHGGSTGAITVVLDTPFTGIVVGDIVFPNAENVETYAQAFLAAMGNLGPGQWSTNPGVVPTANRRPLVTRQQPSDLTAGILKAITDSGDEVFDAAYLYRSSTTPGVPASTTADSPFVLVPRRFGFYDLIP